jgi:hypothetical protein
VDVARAVEAEGIVASLKELLEATEEREASVRGDKAAMTEVNDRLNTRIKTLESTVQDLRGRVASAASTTRLAERRARSHYSRYECSLMRAEESSQRERELVFRMFDTGEKRLQELLQQLAEEKSQSVRTLQEISQEAAASEMRFSARVSELEGEVKAASKCALAIL